MSDLNIGYSFVLGIFAALNPCGFAMLPAYLAMFADQGRADGVRSRARRALLVSAAVTAGFVAVFTVIGALVRSSSRFGVLWSQARWAGLVIGVAMVGLGIAGLVGRELRFSTARFVPAIDGGRDLRSMFVFGVAYAVASIGCTIGLFLSAVLGSFGSRGFLAGVVSIAAYGAGMGLLVTALTISVSVARIGVTDRLRGVGRHLTRISSLVLVVTGAYLAWYWFGAIFRPMEKDPITSAVDGWRVDVVSWLTRYEAATLATVLAAIAAGATAVAVTRVGQRGRPGSGRPS